MPSKRQSTQQFSWPGLDLNYAPFGAEHVGELEAKVGFPLASSEDQARREGEIAQALNRAAQWWRAGEGLDRAPTDRQVDQHLERLGKALERTSELLSLEYDEGGLEGARRSNPRAPSILSRRLAPFVPVDVGRSRKDPTYDPGWTADQAIAVWIEAVFHLRGVVDAARKAADGLAPSTADDAGAGMFSTPAPRALVHSLARIYSAAFGRPIGTSRAAAGGPPGGPAIRFISTALEMIDVAMEAETIDDYLDELRGQTFAPDKVFIRVDDL